MSANTSAEQLAGAHLGPGPVDRFLRWYACNGLRGLPRVWSAMGRGDDDTIRCVTAHGVALDLSPWSYIDRIVLTEGFYESEVLQALRSRIGAGSVLWDIGASLGLHGLTIAKLSPDSSVVCFEPSPAIVGRLWHHRKLNRLSATIIAAGLSDTTGFRPFHVVVDGNDGMSTLEPWSGTTYDSVELVATIRGDELIESGLLPSPSVIKLDVEGHEAAALRGLSKALTSSCRTVVFEDSPEPGTEVKDLLARSGYSFRPLDRVEKSDHNLTNFLAVRD